MIPKIKLPRKSERNKAGISSPPRLFIFLNSSIITLALLVLASCGGPARLPQDVSLDESRKLVQERLIAPLSRNNSATTQLPKPKPRRQLLQVRYHQDSFYNTSFISTLKRLSSIHGFRNSSLALSQSEPELTYDPPATDKRENPDTTSDRANYIIRQGLQLEQYLFSQLKTIDKNFIAATQDLNANLQTQIAEIDTSINNNLSKFASSTDALSQELHQQIGRLEDEIRNLQQKQIPGLQQPTPGQIFGMNLTRDQDGYLDLPPDLALIGSNSTGLMSSKIANLDINLPNPVVWVRFHHLSLAEAIRFLAGHAGLPVLISHEVENMERNFSLDTEARILSILDAVFHQHNVSILYDSDLEVAQITSDLEFNNHINKIRQAIENYNSYLHKTRRLTELEHHQDILTSLLNIINQIKNDMPQDENVSNLIPQELVDLEVMLPTLGQDTTGQLLNTFLADLAALSTLASFRKKQDWLRELAGHIDGNFADHTLTLPMQANLPQPTLTGMKKLEQLKDDRRRLLEMFALAQHLLDGKASTFLDQAADFPRNTGGEVLSSSLHHLTLFRLDLMDKLKTYDTEIIPATFGHGQSALRTGGASDVRNLHYLTSTFPELETIAVHDPCIHPGREVFSEKIAVFGGETSVTKIEAILESYFSNNASKLSISPDESLVQDKPETPANTETGKDTLPDDINNHSISNLTTARVDERRATGEANRINESCAEDPAAHSPHYVRADDFSGFVVYGLISDIELVLKLIEEFDQPQRQVLIEVFMINITRDFGRRLNLTFQTDALAENLEDTEEFFLRRDLTELSHTVTSGNPGGFVSGLISPNHQVQALVDFIETNNLGRTISSPTILVEDGGQAEVSRTLKKTVIIPVIEQITDANGNLVNITNNRPEKKEVKFKLDVKKIQINPNNNNVTIEYELTDSSFDAPLASVTADTGEKSDFIKTRFVAAPGDVIIMAGLFKQADSVNVTGLPGTTTSGLPTSFLLGGEDNIANSVEEMIILMAPTVIEPEIGKTDANSARLPAINQNLR
ncbi:type II secretion system protein GspD [Alphaproteobacteria bacterium LSUCC0684]